MKRSTLETLLLFAFSTCAFGQAARTGTLVGNVTDSSGAAVPDAKVTILDRETRFVSHGVTNPEGAYYLPFLAVSSKYELSVEAAGFKKFVQSGIQVRAAEIPRVDIRLEVGAVTESVEVTGAAPLLETETSIVSQTIEAKQITQMPVLQSKVQRLLYYMVGVQNRGSNYSVVGQSANQLGFTLDGISGKTQIIDSAADANTSVQPSMDALAEAKIYSTGAPAEIGHAAGGMMAMTFKSGTNRFHGVAEDRYMNKAMVHRHYLEQLPRTNPLTYHQMSATLNGPIYIPKLYDGRNRTFFLFGFGRHHEKANDPQTGTIPDLNMRSGNFSFPQVTGGGFPIYDPQTMVLNGTTWTASPFAGNLIPQSRFDTVAKNFLGLDPWYDPNSPATTVYSRSGPSTNWSGYTFYRSYRTRFDGKIDHQISASNKFFVRGSLNRHRQTGRVNAWVKNPLLDGSAASLGRPTPVDQQNWGFADYHTFSPSLMNEVRGGFNRRIRQVIPPTANQGWAQRLGIPNVGAEHFPGLGQSGIGPGSYERQLNEDFTFQDNVTKVRGRHTFKFGYEVIRSRENNINAGTPTGTYNFGTGGTAMPFVNNTGNAFASFLLGAVSSASFNQQLISDLPRWWTHGAYIQTDWKPVRKVTLNLGLRYSYETPYQTRYGNKSQWDPNGVDPLTGGRGRITHPDGYVSKPDRNNFQPRVGLAWNFHPKIVFRGSWGLLFQDLLHTAGTQEYSASANINQVVGDPRPVFYLSQGPPNRPYTFNPDGTSPALVTNNNFTGRGATFTDAALRVPYVMNWSGGFQFEHGQHMVYELLYQGSAAVGLIDSFNWNQLPHFYYKSTDLALLNAVTNAAQNYRPYPNYGTITYTTNAGHNTYHGFVARVEKRYSHGLTLNNHWTWSKNLGGGAGQGWNFDNWKLEKSRTGLDTRQRFIIQAMYELPVGRGRRFLNGGGWTNHILGGWELSWIQTMQSGPAITFTTGGNPARFLPDSNTRPIQISQDVKVKNWSIGPNRFPQSAQNPAFNLNAFAYMPDFKQSPLGAGTESGFWTIWPQWLVSKSWKFYETVTFRLRVEGNNLPVRPQFTAPNSTVNFVNPQSFGRVSQGIDYATLGTGNGFFTLGGRIEF